MMAAIENHPVLFFLACVLAATRVALEFTFPQAGTVFGAAVGMPLTIYVLHLHLELRKELEKRDII